MRSASDPLAIEHQDHIIAMIDSTIVRAHQHSAGAQKKQAKIKRSDDPVAD
jgi:hypothetical protein